MATSPLTLVQAARPSTAPLLQERLQTAEHQIDAGLIGAADLVGTAIRAAREAGLGRAEIQRSLLRLHSSLGHGLKAQWDLQVFHQGCRKNLKKVNVEELGWGDTGNSPQTSLLDDDGAERAILG